MQPVLFSLGPFPIHSYGLMIGIGFLVALMLALRDARRAGLDDKVISDAAFYTLPIGILGTRLLHIFMFPENYSLSDPIGWIAVWRGGLVFQGALPAAMTFLYIYLRRHKVDFWRFCDVVAPYLPLAQAFGRVGCFLNGCCYGKPTDVPWAIPFRRVPWDLDKDVTGSSAFLDHVRRFSDVSLDSHWSHAVHPTQLYSVFGLLLISGIILWVRRRSYPYAGFLVPVYFVSYGIFRFIVEFYRGDHNPVHVFGLSDQQVFSLIFAAVGVALYFLLARRPGARDFKTLFPA